MPAENQANTAQGAGSVEQGANPRFAWLSPLRVEAFSLAQIALLQDAGRIAPHADLTLPWCMLTAPLRGMSARLAVPGISDGYFELPVGFIYNGASIPRPARWWMSPEDPRIIRTAAWHDFLCGLDGHVHLGGGVMDQLTAAEAADQLYLGMRADLASHHDAAIVRAAVNAFGPKWRVA